MRVVLTLLLFVGGPLLLGWWLTQRVRRALQPPAERAVRQVVRVRALPAPIDVADGRDGSALAREDAADEDLLAYPRRLAELEAALVARHRAAQEQLGVLAARRAEVLAKPGREELAQKYARDEALLAQRAEGMRRVLGVVYRTRCVLLLRVHLAGTARRRPALSELPPGRVGASAATYHAAASEVRFYLDTIDARAARIDALVTPPPTAAELDDAQRASILAEQAAVRAEHAAMRERMDHVADTLTYLGDHAATRSVVEADLPGGQATPTQLMAEVSGALDALHALVARVDDAAVHGAVDALTERLGRLEAAGLDAQAETDAHLEVERLLGRMTPT